MKSIMSISDFWRKYGASVLPFADVATSELPITRLLRLALFQVSVGMALVLINGILNRVMIVEMGIAASLVAFVVALPVLFAPLRILIGHGSDEYRSFLGWRRVPFIWFGTLLQFGGFAIMPFALLVTMDATSGPEWAGPLAAAVAFLVVGAGMHTTQTAGLALATDLATDDGRPQIVALLYVLLLVGTVGSAFLFAWLLDPFTPLKLIQVIQGAAVATVILNVIALWKQEVRNVNATRHDRPRVDLGVAWRNYAQQPFAKRLLIAIGLGSAAFGMQDILLEPYGAEILGLEVGETTRLTALLALGTLIAFGFSNRVLQRGGNEYRLAAVGLMVGIIAFIGVIFASPMDSVTLFLVATFLIGVGVGLFSVSSLFAVMQSATLEQRGLALGLWGAVQTTAVGVGIAVGGFARDFVGGLAGAGHLGPSMPDAIIGYSFVYHLEILLLLFTLIAIGPLVRVAVRRSGQFVLMELPG